MLHVARAQMPRPVLLEPVDDLSLVWSSCLFTVLGMGLVVAMAGNSDANPVPVANPPSQSAPGHWVGNSAVIAAEVLPAPAIPVGF